MKQEESEISAIMMETSISVLDKLEKQVNVLIKKSMSVNSRHDYKLNYKLISTLTLSGIVELIKKLKQEEIENSRIDFKEGYIKASLDMGDFFGLSKDEAYPTEEEMKEIDDESFQFIKNKFNLSDEV